MIFGGSQQIQHHQITQLIWGRRVGAPGAIPPPAGANVQAGVIPIPEGGGVPARRGGYQSNKVKWYNNWNYCYSCGYNVTIWYTSAACPEAYRKSGHQVRYTREMVDGYLAAKHWYSEVAHHKDPLLTISQANQAWKSGAAPGIVDIKNNNEVLFVIPSCTPPP
jgi:hypothetical protein